MLSLTTVGLSVLALATAANAVGGIIDNARVFSTLHKASDSLSGDGTYNVVNVATGRSLSFVRGDSTTDVFPQLNGAPLDIQFNGDQARLSGGNNKCVSAQWGFQQGGDASSGQFNNAAVSYACAVGKGELTGSSTLETTKQWWLLVPVDSSDSSSSSSNDNVALFVKPKKSSSSASSDDFSSPSDDSEASPVIEVKAAVVPKTKTSSGKMSASSQASAAGYAPTDDDPATFDYSSVDVRDRSTWICQHPGVWLNAHHPYVDAGHPECADVLANWRRDNLRMAKRSHSELAKVLAKRADQKFYIIAVDHLDDMVTRAIGSGTMSSPGGYTSTVLETWNRSDENQQWVITVA